MQRLPHARGGVSWFDSSMELGTGYSPRLWGLPLMTTSVGIVLVNIDMLGSHMEKDAACTAYLPLLADAIAHHQDIWQSFSQHKGSSKVVRCTRGQEITRLYWWPSMRLCER